MPTVHASPTGQAIAPSYVNGGAILKKKKKQPRPEQLVQYPQVQIQPQQVQQSPRKNSNRGQTPDWIREIFAHAKRGLIDKLVRVAKISRVFSLFKFLLFLAFTERRFGRPRGDVNKKPDGPRGQQFTPRGLRRRSRASAALADPPTRRRTQRRAHLRRKSSRTHSAGSRH